MDKFLTTSINLDFNLSKNTPILIFKLFQQIKAIILHFQATIVSFNYSLLYALACLL